MLFFSIATTNERAVAVETISVGCFEILHAGGILSRSPVQPYSTDCRTVRIQHFATRQSRTSHARAVSQDRLVLQLALSNRKPFLY